MKTLTRTLITSAVVALLFGQAAFAATDTWTGTTSGDWNTAGNWSGGVPINTSTATFSNSVNTTVTLSAAATTQSIAFTGTPGAFTIGTTLDAGITLASGGSISSAATVTNLEAINSNLTLGGSYSFTNNATATGAALDLGGAITNTAAATLTLNGSNTGANTISGAIGNGTGTTTLTKSGTGTWILTGTDSYNGATTVSSGLLDVAGANGELSGTSSITISSGAELLVDDRGAGNTNSNRLDAGTITLANNSLFVYEGSDQASTNSTQTIGALSFASSSGSAGGGISTITIDYNGTNAASVTASAVTNGFTRTASTGGIALVNGVNLGANTAGGGSVGQLLFATAPTMVGTTAATSGINAGVDNTKIVLYLLGESGTASGAKGTATGTANTFLTDQTGINPNTVTGLRPLNPTDEFKNNAIVAGDNTYITSATAGASTAAINSLVINGGTLSISSGANVTDSSGMLLFVTSNAINGAGTFTLGSASNQEGIVAVDAGVTATIGSTLATGTTGLTVYGPGSLYLTGTNSYGGTTAVSGGSTLIIGNNSALGSSTITAMGGTLEADGQGRTIANTLIDTTSGLKIAGSNDLTFTGGGTVSTPAFTNNNFANSRVVVNNTGTTTFSGVFSLLNLTSGSNNGGSVLGVGSGANVVISGPIQDNNSGNVASPGTGFNIAYTGAGGNVSIIGNNGYGNGKTTTINADSSYDTLTLGGPGGAGATITPFGASSFALNTTANIYLVAATNGQILGNSISAGGGSGGDFGFAGTNSMTLGGTYSLGAAGGLTNLSTGTFTFANTISVGSNALSFVGTGNTTLVSGATLTGTTGSLTASQTGTLTLSSADNLTGVTSFGGGTVVLDYSAGSAGGGSNRLTQQSAAGSASALTLGGVNLQLSGGSFAQTLGTPSSGANGTTLTAGQSTIADTNSGTSTIALGAITRAANNGAAINFGTGVASTTSTGANGILGGYATVNGTNWAVGGGTITALSSYSTLTNGTLTSSGNYYFTGSSALTTSATAQTVYSLKMDATASLTLGNTLTITTGGLLFDGGSNVSITGSTLQAASGVTDLIVQQYGAGTLTIGSIIGGAGDALTKAGTGILALSNASNSYTGGTFLDSGVLQVSAAGDLGTGTLTFNGGTLETTAGLSFAHNVSLGTNGGTFQVDTGTLTLTSAGVVSGTTYGGLTKTGAGTLLLQGTNTFVGPVTVSAGTLQLGSAAALGASSTASNRSTAPVLVNGGTLDIDGQTTALGNVTLQSGAIADSAGTGTLAAYSFNLESGTVGAAIIDDVISGNTASNSTTLDKTTSGTVILTGNNTYSGATLISGGTLQVGNNGTTGTLGSANVNTGETSGTSGTLAFDRSDSSYVVGNAITGAGSVSQIGSGATTITSSNSYSGGTTVSTGSLYVNNTSGSGTGTGAVSVASGATLAGFGTIAPTTGGVTVNGTLSSGGVQTLGSGLITTSGLTLDNTTAHGTILTVNSGSTLSFNLGYVAGNPANRNNFAAPISSQSTFLNVLGNTSAEITFTAGGIDTINLVDLTNGTGQSLALANFNNPYLLIQAGADSDYSGLVTTGGADANGYVLGVANGSGGYNALDITTNSTYSYVDLSLYLYNGDLEVVPEPSTWAMMIGGLTLLLVYQGKRRRQP